MVEEGLHYIAPGQIAPYTRTRVYHSARAKQLTYIIRTYVRFAKQSKRSMLINILLIFHFPQVGIKSSTLASVCKAVAKDMGAHTAVLMIYFIFVHIHSPFIWVSLLLIRAGLLPADPGPC